MLPTIPESDILQSMLDFMPEVILCIGIVFLLVLRLVSRGHVGGWAFTITLVALGISVLQWLGPTGLATVLSPFGIDRNSETGKLFLSIALESPKSNNWNNLFGGLLVYDGITVYLRVFLYSFTSLVIWLTLLTGIPDQEDSADFYTLLLGATLGMALMASSVHLLMIFMAIEMASLPSYALAGFLKGRRQSSEAALKYVVYGGGAAGVMLYGISLLAGKFGTGYLPDVAAGVVANFTPTVAGSFDPVVLMGLLFILVGVAFKLSAVPFHFWCPDVFEGASAEVAGFLSVASKGAALALLARILLLMSGLDPLMGDSSQVNGYPFKEMIAYLLPILAFFAAVTATFGNLAAYLQTNLKRMLAYSTIAHAGYMLMGLCTLSRAGVEAVLFYLVAYLFMNLGAFAVIAFLRNQTRSEDLGDFAGLVRRSPLMVITLSVFLLSLLGIPPLVGFAAKFQIFAVLFKDSQTYYANNQPGLGATLIGLLVIAGLNTVLSAFYYLKVMKVMILDRRAEDLEGAAPIPVSEPVGNIIYASVFAVCVVLMGILWGPIGNWSEKGVSRFRKAPGVDFVDTRLIQDNPIPKRGPRN